jgi:hypothetical protein
MVCRKLSHVIGASFTVCFIFAMGLNASAHAQGVWDFDPQKAFDRLPEFIRAVQSEETGQTASEEVRIIREMIAMTSDEAWEKYQVNTKDGSVGWGPFRAGYSQTDFQKELRQLQQTYSSARSEEEFRKAFVTSSRRYLTPDGRAIVMRYIEAIERGQRIAASSREFFTVTSPKATPTAITVAVSCPHMPNGVVSSLDAVAAKVISSPLAAAREGQASSAASLFLCGKGLVSFWGYPVGAALAPLNRAPTYCIVSHASRHGRTHGGRHGRTAAGFHVSARCRLEGANVADGCRRSVYAA